MYIITSYYTKNTPYEKVIKEYLINSLEKLNLSYWVSGICDLGSHQKNANYKPRHIHNVMNETEFDIVFVDADAEILQIPTLFSFLDCDIACHLLDWGEWYGHSKGKYELLPGTLYVKNNYIMRNFIELWAELSENSPHWDGQILQKLLDRDTSIKFFNLPLEYCYIKTLPNGELPLIKVSQPVIVHNQVSRLYRKDK